MNSCEAKGPIHVPAFSFREMRVNLLISLNKHSFLYFPKLALSESVLFGLSLAEWPVLQKNIREGCCSLNTRKLHNMVQMGLYLDQAFDGLSEYCRLLMKDRLANEH